ncbi:hypothetical protein BZG02_19615 [Labilibaculum filiforme]|uniref:PA14 domain-containing protein n=1 Tax=Labilibaculum filiforme TaxID=1940526 RepID=A0A2N3HQR0_9BACT|nr:choice-of-anchor L domain-containing protein [Labilibaculum filiforme]PKQ60394.1 hypothetical protein BZG02_19615 [Labilibaculum filiforme]
MKDSTQNIFIKLSLLIFFLSLSGSLLGQTATLVHPTTSVSKDGSITISDWSGNKRRIVIDGDWQVKNVVDFSGLDEGDYVFEYWEKVGKNWMKISEETLSLVAGALSYCSSSGNISYDTSITGVTINTINKVTPSNKTSGYNDFTSESTDVIVGNSYNLTVNLNTDYGAYTVYAVAWIDWNQNADFENSEIYHLGTAYNTTNGPTSGSPYSISVPSSALLGATRMRISAKWDVEPTACENNFDGEVEDYTLNIVSNGAMPVAKCKDQTIQLDALGNASISAADINNGSSDVETSTASLILSLDKSTFDCSDIGTNDVVLSVEDEDGNVSTCTATVTVQDQVAPSLLNLNADYYTGINFGELKYSESVSEINNSWAYGSPNESLVGLDYFTIRYSGTFVVPVAGNYTFYTNSDDGVRLVVDGTTVVDNWNYQAPTEKQGTINLASGQHTIKLEYFENSGGAVIELRWESVDAGVSKQIFSKTSILNSTVIETTLKLNTSGTATLAATDVDPGFLDNCGVTSRTLSKTNFTTADVGTNTVVLTVKDDSGNSTSINVTVIVEPSTPEVVLSVSPSSIIENGGNTFVTATLTGIASTDVLVNLIMSGTASTSDYSISKLQIKIPAGSLSASVTISSVNDAIIEGNEILNVNISSITGGTGGGTQMVMITIVDDDFPSEESIEVNRQANGLYDTPEKLVSDVLVTGCLKADNITYSGDDKDGVGYFSAGDSDFPLSSGVIISTGKVRNAEGENDGGNKSDNIDGSAYDPDVFRLAGYSAQDAQILEFDFVPAGDQLEFNYIFASDEYHEFVGSAYNDVFGFILSGPGINGSFSNGGENIALIPSSTDNVSINNVNRSSNSLYYVDTPADFATSFDGRTTVLTARASVTPCETYHIRLIISDVSDNKINSAVFLEAESFKSNEVEIQNGIGVEDDVDFMYEGCGGSYIKFVRKEDFEDEMTFELNISGTAANGVDYLYVDQYGNQIGDGKIPTTVTLPAGLDELVYYYKAVSDSNIEGDEELRLSFLKNCPCSAPDYYEKVVTIIDIPEIQASPTSLVSCLGATPVATITIDLKSGLDPSDYQYSIDGGSFQDNNVFTLSNPTVGESHTVTVQDRFACQSASFEIVMPAVTPIAAEAGPSKTICEGKTVNLDGSGGIYYEWSCSPKSGETYLSNINASNPTVSADIPFGTYTFTLTVKESNSATASCVDTDFMVLTVNENSHFSIISDKTEYCSGEVINLSSTILNSSGGDSYSWTPLGGIDSPTSANTTASYSTTVLSAKDFSLTITKSNGCKNTEYISGVLINPHPVLSLKASSNTCSNGSDGVLNVNVTGGTRMGTSPFYDFSWSHNGSLNSPDATGLGAGNYTITVTDAKSCSSIATYDVATEPEPKGIYHE